MSILPTGSGNSNFTEVDKNALTRRWDGDGVAEFMHIAKGAKPC